MSALIDGADFFGALRSSMLKAEHSIVIVGWDVDSRVRLRGAEAPDDGGPERLRDFLCYLAERNPSLKIQILLWDFSILYALEREPIPALNLAWVTPPQIEVCLDDVVPLGASHHQKIAIIDGKVAYCGGLDLAIRRWDTRDHDPDHPERVDPNGVPYPPFHDMQSVVDGDAATAITELVAERWEAAACKPLELGSSMQDPWPDGVLPDFEHQDIAIARTCPPLGDRPGIYEIEALFVDMIGTAEKTIYIENQFLTADVIAHAVATRMKARPELETILVSSKEPHGFLETHSMATGRERFMQHLNEAGVIDRVRLVYPRVPDGSAAGQDVQIHSKFMVIDDRLLRIGSANLNNRSMGTDGECDLVVAGDTPNTRARIARLRNNLLGEHLGLSLEDAAAEIERHNSLRALIDARADEPRSLRRIPFEVGANEALSQVVTVVADPERPGDVSRFMGNMLSARPAGLPIRGRILTAGAIALATLLFAVWQYSPLAEFTEPARLEQLIVSLRGDPWAYLIVPVAFIIGSLAMFPVTAMITATAIAFPPIPAFVMAMSGALLGAVANYVIGAAAGRKFLRRLMGKRLNKISRALARRGTLTVVMLRIVPVAPFTLINLVAGASHIRFEAFVFGSFIGLTPGIVALTFVGDRLFELLQNPTPAQTAWVIGAVALWFGIAAGARWLVTRIAGKDGPPPP